MTGRPQWNRHQDPKGLLRYVPFGAATSLLPSLPARAEDRGGGALARVSAVFDAFAGVGIRYADEPIGSADGWQMIRLPSEVLTPPRLANCVDVAVTFAGACLDAGAHPLLVVLEPVAGGPAHALVVVWLGGRWTATGGAPEYRDFAPDTDGRPIDWPGGLRATLDGPGAFLPIDVVALAADDVTSGPASLADAVAAGARLLATAAWTVAAVVDVGLDHDPRGALAGVHRPLTGIVSHAEMLAGLDGLQRNLLDGNLPFVPPPDPASPLLPRNLLARLAAGADNPAGVLLVGAAGVGKTRTCFEVGRLAVRNDWAVLHVTSGEPAVTIAELHEAIVTAGSERVLVIMDYLNEARIDLPSLRNKVVPAARRAGIRVALLASCRAGWFATRDPIVDQVFTPERVEPGAEQSALIRDRILTELAPRAIATLSLERLRELCGLRPVIAMLIAAEAERLATEGSLTAAAAGLRSADLLYWLARRLREDRLVPEPVRDPFADDDPGPSLKLQACVAMLAAAPQSEPEVLECGNALAGLPAGNAPAMLRLLRSMGWVVDGPAGVGPVHDLVTDHLVEKILLHGEPLGGVREAVTDNVLTASLHRGRTIGRYAVNIGRVLRDLPSADSLREHCAAWLTDRADAVGDVLASTVDEGAYALGALLDNAAWSTVAFTSWDSIVAPWLARHSHAIPARHLLYRGLRSAPPEAKAPLVDEALGWLNQHGALPEASFVLATLLPRVVTEADAATTIRHAIGWLDQHGTVPEADFVLAALLPRVVAEADVTTITRHAVTWLDQHSTLPQASFLLAALLPRELSEADAATIVRHAVTWLDQHGAVIEASFVLKALLPRDLTEADAATAIGHAIGWLEQHGTVIEADFVLAALLPRDLAEADAATTIGHAITWLDQHSAVSEARFVLTTLLLRDLTEADAATTIRHAVTWLDRHSTIPEATFLLAALLPRDLTEADATTVTRHAVAWLDQHGTIPEASFVLKALLPRDLTEADAATTIGHAITWLDLHGTGLDADFVLKALLLCELTEADAATTIGHAITWLDLHGAIADAQFVLGRLLARTDLGERQQTVVGLATRWTEVNGVGNDWVSKLIVRRKLITPPIAASLVAWAIDHPGDVDIGWRLGGVARALSRWEHLTDDLLRAVEYTLWTSPPDATQVQGRPEMDVMFDQLCWSIRGGIAAARLDDLVRIWAARSDAFGPPPPRIRFPSLVSRVCSLLIMKEGVPDHPRDLLDRLEAWVQRWHGPGSAEDQAVALNTVRRYRTLIERRARGALS